MEMQTKMVCSLQIAQAQRDGGGQSRDRRPPNDERCIWCDIVGHVRRECTDFADALRSNVMYLWNGRVHARHTLLPVGVVR